LIAAADLAVLHVVGMGILGRIDRATGRFNRWFGSAAMATAVEDPGTLADTVG